MKRFFHAATAALASLLVAWYCTPGVYRLLHLPDCVSLSFLSSAPTLSVRSSDAKFVRESGDERLLNASNQTIIISLFGLLPLKTVSVPNHEKTVIPGGEAVGIVLKANGVQIVGFETVETDRGGICPAVLAGLKEGDMICSMNGTPVRDSESFSALFRDAAGACELNCIRDGKPFSVSIVPETDRNGVKKIGAWVRDSTSGIGTVSFYDERTGSYTALGHGVTDVDTQKLIAPASGYITSAEIVQIRKGGGNSAGELIGQFSVSEDEAIGTVEQNTVFGISGTFLSCPNNEERSVPVASCGAAHRGDAYILSNVDGAVSAYSVRVIRIDVQSRPETQGMMIEITDPELIRKTGGIVQGMSGSPLIQDGKLIGVVTHVFLSQPTRGYCIYSEWMVRELLPAS